jgi:Ni,Fe-hydrogenase I cytochrome b subunit
MDNKFKKELELVTLIGGAGSLVVALSFRDAVRSAIDYYFPISNGATAYDNMIASITYAICIFLIVYIVFTLFTLVKEGFAGGDNVYQGESDIFKKISID